MQHHKFDCGFDDAGCLAEARLQIAFISVNVQLGSADQ